MEADLRIINDLKNQIERGRSFFRKLNKDSMTESYVMARLEGLEELLNKFSNKHESIIANYESEDLQESGYIENDVFHSGYEIYLSYKSELNSALSSRGRYAMSQPTSSYANKDSLVKLPKISIPVFSGHYAEWSSFKDLFVSLVHNNTALDDVQRLYYLKTQLKGEAEQLIKHIPTTQANYTKCWETLQERYNNKRFMLNCILKRLFNQQAMASESSSGLKGLLDTTSDCIHELTNLGISVESWDLVIIYIVSLKLDAETRKQWELHVNNNLSKEEFPTFVHLREFLERRFRAAEFVEHGKTKSSQNNHNNLNAFHTTLDVTCSHCIENHETFPCSSLAKEYVKNCHDMVKSTGLYCNCLGKRKGNCPVPMLCRCCWDTAEASFSTVAVIRKATETDQIDKSTQISSLPTNDAINIADYSLIRPKEGQTLLPTALIKAETRNGNPQILKALLDQGSEASFISEAAVHLLGLNKVATKSRISGISGNQSDLTSEIEVMLNIQSLHKPNFNIPVKAYVLKEVTAALPKQEFVLPYWASVDQINLADPQFNSPSKIDILLGAEVYSRILKKGLIKHPTRLIIAQDTHLGWVLSGQVDNFKDTKRKKTRINEVSRITPLIPNVNNCKLSRQDHRIVSIPSFKYASTAKQKYFENQCCLLPEEKLPT